jgi:RNA polymerase sigma-70 factor (ECF subfamily)
VYSKVLSFLKNKEDAEDVAQEIFIKVFHKLPRFRQEASFSTWLYAVTVNTCLSHIEKATRNPLRWIEDDLDEARISQREDEAMFAMVGRGAERDDLHRLIQRALNGMGELSREILTLRFIEELDYQTIAAKLGIGLSATKMRLKRAREEFRRAYEQLTVG